MAKYYVTYEISVLGGFVGYPTKSTEIELEPEKPVNAKRFYDILNKDVKSDLDKTGDIIAWSKIEED